MEFEKAGVQLLVDLIWVYLLENNYIIGIDVRYMRLCISKTNVQSIVVIENDDNVALSKSTVFNGKVLHSCASCREY